MKALLLFVIASVSVNAQLTDEAGRRLAEATVRSALNMRADDFLQVRRAEDLEEYLGIASGHAHHKLFYRVSRDGTVADEHGVRTGVLSDGDPLFVVVVDADGDAYRVHRFHDSTSEFNRLLVSSGLKLASAQQVEALGDLYRATNPGNFDDLKPINSLLELKQGGERRCFRYDAPLDSKPFDEWWASAKRKYKSLSYEPKIAHEGRGFSLEWIVLSSPGKYNCGGAPLRVSIDVGLDGQVVEPKFVPIN